MTTNKNKELYLFLSLTLFNHPKKAHSLLEKFQDFQSLSKESNQIKAVLSPYEKQQFDRILENFNLEIYLEKAKKLNTTLLFINQENYPPLLKETSFPPLVLYCQGNLDLLKEPSFAIVGSRSPSQYGETNTQHFTQVLSSHFTIVSGLALGIDAIAHQQCLDNPKSTIAVLANGVDVIYPKSNSFLQENICKKGLLISEFPLGCQPSKRYFPQRNRIISGLSQGVLIPEAKQKSGSLITAYYANEQNRDVFAIPGSIHSNQSEGCHNLINEGAKLCQNPQDILQDYQLKPIKNLMRYKEKQIPLLDDDEKKVLEIITDEAISIDKLLFKSNLSLPKLLQILSFLELENLIYKKQQQYFKKQ